MMRPYKYRRHLADKIAVCAFAGVILLSVTALFSSGETDIDGKAITLDKPSPVVEAAAAPTEGLSCNSMRQDAPMTNLQIAEPSAELEASPEPTLTYIGKLQIYGYNPWDAKQCGKSVADGITASGVVATIGRTAAMKDYPFGTEIYIEGLGYFVVEDRGVGAGVVDVACASNKACYAITGKYDVYIVER